MNEAHSSTLCLIERFSDSEISSIYYSILETIKNNQCVSLVLSFMLLLGHASCVCSFLTSLYGSISGSTETAEWT